MKKFTLTLVALVSLAGFSHAAVSLSATSFRNGLTDSSGVALSTGATILYGYLPGSFNFATNGLNFAALDSAFVEVARQDGVQASGFDGFFNYTLGGINEAGTFESVSYASTIAGQPIYAWVLNNTNPAAATEWGVFSTGSETWGDAFNPAFTFTLQDNVPGGLNVHVGSAGGPVINPPGTLGASYQLAAVPEPSRAVLGFLGLGALFLRRRR